MAARADVLPENFSVEKWSEVEETGTEITESFDVPFPREQIWAFFSDLRAVADCMPGARITDQSSDRALGELTVKLGPISTAFFGALEISRDDRAFKGVVRGSGRDTKSMSAARGIVAYRVIA
ncbi:MAG: SRPBCC domain-containing protein, partial [Candidatus Binatia bacterium]